MSSQFLDLGRKLISHLSFSNKFALLGGIFVIPLLFLLTGSYQYQQSAIEFSAKEQEGLRMIYPLREFLQPLQSHRGLSLLIKEGNENLAERLEQQTQKANTALASAEQANLALGKELNLFDAYRAIQTQWEQLRTQDPDLNKAESFRQHSDLAKNVLQLIGQTADSSNLTLDSDLDSFYLMDAITVRLPAIIEGTAKLRGLSSGIAQRKTVTSQEQIALHVQLNVLQEHTSALEADLARSLTANPALGKDIEQPLAALKTAGENFRKSVDTHILRAETISVSPASLFQEGSTTVDSAYTLFDANYHALDRLIAHRIQDKKHLLYRDIVLTFTALAIALYLFMALRSILLAGMNELSSGAKRLATGDFSTPVKVPSKDEMGTLGEAINQIQSQLGEKITQERRIADDMRRIRFAIDSVSTAVTLLDTEQKLIYCNMAGQELLNKVLGNAANRLIGERIDTLFDSPEKTQALIAPLSETSEVEIHENGFTLRLIMAPVQNESGQETGRVLQWLDRTQEIALENEIENMICAAALGDFSTRLDTAGKSGFHERLSEGLNQLSETTAGGLKRVAAVLQAIANGDLTQTIDTRYEGVFGQLKNDTNLTVERLREVVSRIKIASETINTAAMEIAAGNGDLSLRTEQQASHLEETASSMEEINATVKNNADNAGKANQLASDASGIAARGGEMVKAVVDTMTDIQRSSRKISDIIGVIDGIAFQTNILALNAAVEAARAGEQGRGFAVVATEVRNLAQRSATAAKEIKQLINDSVTKVDGGVLQVGQAGTTIGHVVSAVKDVANLLQEISHASREQASGVEQVTQAIARMDETTQQNAALVEEAAAAAESLEEQARTMVDTIGVFKISTTSLSGEVLTARPNAPEAVPVLTRPAPPPALPSSLASEEDWEEF